MARYERQAETLVELCRRAGMSMASLFSWRRRLAIETETTYPWSRSNSLTNDEVIVNLIANTTTTTGLTVRAAWDKHMHEMCHHIHSPTRGPLDSSGRVNQ